MAEDPANPEANGTSDASISPADVGAAPAVQFPVVGVGASTDGIEERGTSKAIDSPNEELATVNDALQGRNQELSQAYNDFVNLLASVQMAIVMLGPDFRIRRFTPAAEKMLNLISTDIGRPIGDIRLRVDVPDFDHLLREVMESMTPREVEVRDKEGRWYSLRIRPYRTMENRIEGVVVVLVDIDSLKHAEQSIRAAAERLRLVQDLAPVGIFEADSKGLLLDANERLSQISGYGREELQRRRLVELLHGEDAELVAKKLADARPQGVPQHFDARLRRKDGTLVWVEVSYASQRTDGGRGEILLGTVNDISERRENEQALAETESRFRQLADSVPVLIWINGPAGAEFVNRAYREHVGVPETDLLGSSWQEFVHPEDRASYLRAYEEAYARGSTLQAQFRFRRSDGSYRWMKSIGLPRLDARGQLVGYVGASFDVHDLKLAESALREADQRKNEFLAVLAHELRNPLAPLRNVIEMMRVSRLDDGDLGWAREVMDRQVEAMARMVEDLLDVSRITQGKVQLRLEPQDLTPILQRTAEAWRRRFEQSGLALELNLPESPVMTLVDAVRFEQVIGNLLGNALKFTPRGGSVRIECDGSEAEWASVRVRDDGKGISPDELPRIFDLFMQVDRTLDRAHGGLGIGLTLVRRLIELHGGTVEAKSDGAGLGAEFSIRLPRLVGTPSRTSTAERSQRESGRSRRILVVDDNVDGAVSWAMLLKLQGHDVEIAHDGPQALERAAEFQPEVALVDIGLPGMDGIEVGRRLRQADSDGLLLIAVSGYAAEEDRARTRAAGFDHHFRKPLEPDVLFDLLERAAPS